MDRKDKFFGPLHMIVRSDTYENNWGLLFWVFDRKITADLWLGKTMIAFRRNEWR